MKSHEKPECKNAWRRRPTWAVAVLALALGLLAGAPLGAQQELTVESNHGPLVIPDDDANFPIESTLAVDADLEISDVNVTVNIDHDSVGDLELDLFAPNGERVRLADEVCDDRDDFANTVFDDEAGQEIGDVCPPGAGPYRPDDSLDEFDEEFSRGLWTLVVEDVNDDTIGALLSWSLEITGNFVSSPVFSSNSIVSAASFQGGAVAVGEMATIFGAALGPAAGVTAQLDPETGRLPMELAGVRVFFDEIQAPLFYVSSSQINTQVPFEVSARPDVNVRVEFDETGEGTVTTNLLEAGPAVFTLNGRGQGRAVALNPNGSVNDAVNPVAPGRSVSIYATGFGVVEPPIETGAPATADPLHRVVAPVEATVGGVPAEVTFAGLAPGFVALYQIDIQLAESTPTGRIVQLQLSVGDRNLENLTWITVGSR